MTALTFGNVPVFMAVPNSSYSGRRFSGGGVGDFWGLLGTFSGDFWGLLGNFGYFFWRLLGTFLGTFGNLPE